MKRFGAIPETRVGALFNDRKELRAAGIHLPTVPGIHGTAADGADSIVLNGGYENEDYGDYILYVGEGGARKGNRLTEHQTLDSSGNAGLLTSELRGLPVRVTRGAKHRSPYSPPAGYRYAGLYLVTDHIVKTGRDGFDIVQFRLDRVPEQDPYVSRVPPTSDPAFASSVVIRRIRDTEMSRAVKNLYENRCQICDLTLRGFQGRTYAEGAHVRPLGRPHLGADERSNLLCLCPNHHVLLDTGGIWIGDGLEVRETTGAVVGGLTFRQPHSLNTANAEYHRRSWGF